MVSDIRIRLDGIKLVKNGPSFYVCIPAAARMGLHAGDKVYGVVTIKSSFKGDSEEE